MDRTGRRTEFGEDGTKVDQDPVVGVLDSSVDMHSSWFNLSIEVNNDEFIYRIGIDSDLGQPVRVNVASLAYVFSSGRVLVQSRYCRVILRSICVEEL